MSNWAYTSLAANSSVRLVIDTGIAPAHHFTSYDIAQVTASFAINEIPSAVCMLAVGREATNNLTPAAANTSAGGLKQMWPARVFATLQGDMDTDGTLWPGRAQSPVPGQNPTEQLIFDGYFTGFGYQKVDGKINVAAHLIHWLVDMTFSSCLSANSHVSNSINITSQAALNELGANTSDKPMMISAYLGAPSINDVIQVDVWEALKTMMCAMANQNAIQPIVGPPIPTVTQNTAQLIKNTRAINALTRIEGPCVPTQGVQSCSFNGGAGSSYEYGLPLALFELDANVAGGISDTLSHQFLADLWNQNFWDVLINTYCSGLGLIVCPGIDRAIVAADMPGFSNPAGTDNKTITVIPGAAYPTSMWRNITPNEYDFVDYSGMLPRPLRAVVVYGAFAMEHCTNFSGVSGGSPTNAAGFFASSSVSDSDGVIMYTQTPDWISSCTLHPTNPNGGHAAGVFGPVNTGTTPGAMTSAPPGPIPSQLTAVAGGTSDLLARYAQMRFIIEQLRGRSGSISGRLRFDIGPGSHIKLVGDPEPFLATSAQDQLAEDMYCQVTRVTYEINAEARRAATAIQVNYLRNAEENNDPRTSSPTHPFYGSNIMLGFPLLPAFDSPAEKGQ